MREREQTSQPERQIDKQTTVQTDRQTDREREMGGRGRKREGIERQLRETHSFLGLNGEGKHSVGTTALPVHRGGGHSPVHPASPQDLVGIPG